MNRLERWAVELEQRTLSWVARFLPFSPQFIRVWSIVYWCAMIGFLGGAAALALLPDPFASAYPWLHGFLYFMMVASGIGLIASIHLVLAISRQREKSAPT
jgi:hypothetical protein